MILPLQTKFRVELIIEPVVYFLFIFPLFTHSCLDSVKHIFYSHVASCLLEVFASPCFSVALLRLEPKARTSCALIVWDRVTSSLTFDPTVSTGSWPQFAAVLRVGIPSPQVSAPFVSTVRNTALNYWLHRFAKGMSNKWPPSFRENVRYPWFGER